MLISLKGDKLKPQDTKKIIVVHPFQQHSFKTAVSVKECGMLYKYITTVYDKEHSFTHFIIRFLRGDNRKRALKRKTNSLSDSDVLQINELLSLFLLFVQRLPNNEKLYYKVYRRLLKAFSKKAANYILKQDCDAVIVYDILSFDLIKRLKSKSNLKIILDMSAPYYNYMEKVFSDDLKAHSEGKEHTLKQLASPLYSYRRYASKYEIENADAFLVASNFTEKSLVISGIDKNCIFKCIYGVDDVVDLNKTAVPSINTTEPLRVMFVGRVSQQKGAYQLLRVADRLDKTKFIFNIYGTYNDNDEIIKSHKSYMNFKGHIPRASIINEYSNNDVLVFTSLSDGFGFVTVEALANSVPVIISCNAGSCELISEYKNGFVIEPGDDDALERFLNLLQENRELLYSLKKNSAETIRSYTWKNYSNQLSLALENILKGEKNEIAIGTCKYEQNPV